MKKKYQKNKIKSQNFLKNNDSPKNRKKRGAKEEQYLEEHIENTKVSCVSVCYLVPCLCCYFHPPYLFFTHLSPCYPPYLLVCYTPGTWSILDQQREQVLWTIIQHYFLLLTYVPDIHIILCVPSKLHKLFRSVQKRALQSRYHCLTGITNQPPVVPPTACVGKNFARAW